MKEKQLHLWDRILLALYALAGMLVTAALGVAAILDKGLELRVAGYAIRLGEGVWPSIVVGVVALVALAWSVYILVLAFRRKPRMDKECVSVQNTENGAVRISLQAIDTLVKQAIGQDEGIVDIRTNLVNHEDSISVNIEMTLQSDVHIPNITMLMQRSIKNYIEEFSGIAVRDVTIMVTKIIEVTPQPPLALDEQAGEKPQIPEPQSEPDARTNDKAVEPEIEIAPVVAPEIVPEPEAEPEVEAAPEPEETVEAAPASDIEQAESVEDAEPIESLVEEAEEAPEKSDEAESFSEKDIW